MATPEPDDEQLQRLEQQYQSGRRSRRGFLRGRRGHTRKALLALGVFFVLGGLVPILQYVDAATVPDGVTSQQAEVLDVGRTAPSPGTGSSRRGRSAVVRLPDGSQDEVYLASRLDYPDAGDTLTVYREDDRLRTTAERSRLGLGGGLLLVLVLPVLTVWWLRSNRREPAGRGMSPRKHAP